MPVKFWSLLGDAVKPTTASLLPAGLLLLSPIPLHSCVPRVCFPNFHETCTTTEYTLFFGGKANTSYLNVFPVLWTKTSTFLCCNLDEKFDVGGVLIF